MFQERRLTAWEVVDEVLTEMSDENFARWSKDRLEFRNILIDEIKDYVVIEDDVVVVDALPERDEETGEWL